MRLVRRGTRRVFRHQRRKRGCSAAAERGRGAASAETSKPESLSSSRLSLAAISRPPSLTIEGLYCCLYQEALQEFDCVWNFLKQNGLIETRLSEKILCQTFFIHIRFLQILWTACIATSETFVNSCSRI